MNIKVFFITISITFLTTLLATKRLIPILAKRRIGQKILEIGPSWHKGKNGTPTMGGVSFILASLISFFFVMVIFGQKIDNRELYSITNILVYGLLNALIGAIDDIAKIRKNKNEGLTPKGKLILQSLASVVFLILMKYTVGMTTKLNIPYFDVSIELGFSYYIFAFLLLCGITNAVNLTDGIDGLASTCVLTVGMFFYLVSATKAESVSLGFFGALLLGTSLAFLIFNLHPAKIFMGDTGSLFFGGIIVGTSFIFNSPLLVLLFGISFVLEALSVILQVMYFKLTKGKRLFKMAPLHHHLEKSGYSEMRVVSVFGIVNIVFCLIAYFGVK